MDLVSVGSITGSITNWLLQFHGAPAYALVGALVFAEAALLVGFVFPGETAVVVGGILASVGSVQLWAILMVAILGAILGDTVGFALGRTVGPWLLGHRHLRESNAVVRTTALMERYGGSAVFIGRFLTFARAVVPGLAGLSGLRYRTFVFYNAIGGLLWAGSYTLLGYLVGRSLLRVVSDLGTGSLVVLALILVVLAGNTWRHRRRSRAELSAPRTATAKPTKAGLHADSIALEVVLPGGGRPCV